MEVWGDEMGHTATAGHQQKDRKGEQSLIFNQYKFKFKMLRKFKNITNSRLGITGVACYTIMVVNLLVVNLLVRSYWNSMWDLWSHIASNKALL